MPPTELQRLPRWFWLVVLALSWTLTVHAQPDGAASAAAPERQFEIEKQRAEQLAQQGDAAGALGLYEQLDERFSAQLSAGQRQELKTLILQLEYQTSSLFFSDAPPGTQVFVDGKKLGGLPLERPIRVNAGMHRIKLFKPGFEPLEKSVRAVPGESIVISEPLVPTPSTGELAVQVKLPPGYTTEPAEVLTILIDGRAVGSAPWRGKLSEGQHRVALESQRFAASERVIQVEKKAVTDVILHAEPRLARLDVDARTGTIKLNGEFAAHKYFSGKLPPGRYVVSVERPGFETYTTTVELNAGQHLDVPVPIATQASVPGTPHDEATPQETGTGIYFEFVGAALFGVGSTHAWAERCPELNDPMTGEPLATGCDTRIPLGGALGARLGLRLGGVVGLEGFVLGAGDWSKASLSGFSIPGVPSELQDMQIGRIGGVLGGGIRLSTPPADVRLSVGAGAGIAFRRVYSNVSSLDGSATGYVAPTVLADASIVIGNTLAVGLLVWAEFADNVEIEPDLASLGGSAAAEALEDLQSVTVFEGTQLFLGPVLAIHFGS